MNTFEIENLGVREMTPLETEKINGGDGIGVAFAYAGLLLAAAVPGVTIIAVASGVVGVGGLIYSCIEASR
ncbi:MAG: hypothetical protein JW801_09255 [Bacteroidales bacterium]|nr:hypothetical protein [Bacteroidales bacterium]